MREKTNERKEVGFIAVSVGDGINEIFKGLGVDYIIEGGQTMNPSTEDMLNAIEKVRLPSPQSDLAQQITKDPYIIDIMGIRQNMEEKEIEAHLDAHISQYLLELGKGFTYYGHQVHLNVGGEDFYIDQLFYNVRLHCYVVVELKTVKFKPEHIGQLNFYVSAVDNQMRTDKDNPTIGLLICKDKNDVVAEYTLRNVDSPIGVSSVKIYDQLTADYKSSLPTIEEIEAQLKDMED